MPVVLWSDVLVWGLFVAAIGFCFYVRRHAHLRAAWRRVFIAPASLSAAIVLTGFVIVGLLDSVHYRARIATTDRSAPVAYSVQVISVLDWLLEAQRIRVERTYSAPLATHAYVKESASDPDTVAGRDFPRLRHGGAHLKDPNRSGADIFQLAFGGALVAAFSWLLFATIIALWRARALEIQFNESAAAIWRGDTDLPWRTALITIGLLALVFMPVFMLATSYHVLGTDKVGQDVFYQSLKSIRTALVIGGLTTLIGLPIGIAAGIAAGYFKGWVDDLITYVYTTISAIPSVLLIVALVLMLQVWLETNPEWFKTTAERADIRLLALCAILGLTSWPGLARLLRGEVLKLRELEYVQAARAFGVGQIRLLWRHVLPNVMHIVLISAAMEFSGLVLAEAVLSYIGVGVDPTMVSFGTMINAARLEMAREPMVWWTLAAAFMFMFVLVLAANLFADGMRDAFDPRVLVGPRRRDLSKASAAVR